ncbi:MAG: glycoside hydrolase family 13 protein [Clostridiales bacterium]|nr:glycoside hydrolase family 13 protein [Clostridiales bacterium]
MELYHNSQDLSCRAPLGALPFGSNVRLRLFVSGKAHQVTLRTWNGGEKTYPMIKCSLGCYEATVALDEHPHIFWYDFHAQDERGRRLYLGNAYDGLGGVGAVYQDTPPSFQITVYDPAWDTPHYLRQGIMYQIFPDRFYRSKMPVSNRDDVYLQEDWHALPFPYGDGKEGSNAAKDFFGGNLQGIILKLPYLKDLGISIIYLNPIFKARNNHRYDTGDYTQIDPLLGTQEDFNELCEKARDLGIRIMLDGVFSHTGDDSIYFNRYDNYPGTGAYGSKKSPHYSWYRFTHYPEKYACWWDIDTLPEVNKNCASFRKFILGDKGIARLWIKRGAIGWRLDVADELPMSFLRELRQAVQTQDPDATLLGEVWEDASNKMAYGKMRSYCLGDTLDTVMNYPLRAALISFFTHQSDACQLVRVIRSLQENYPKPFFYSLMNLMGSHDRARILNLLVKKDYSEMPPLERGLQKLAPDLLELAIERLKKMLTVILAMPGMPSLYYGDEAGMQGAADPYNRAGFPWEHEHTDLTEFFKEAFHLRNSRPILRTGFFDISYEGKDTLVIYRSLDDNGLDAFGAATLDKPYMLRISRDGILL